MSVCQCQPYENLIMKGKQDCVYTALSARNLMLGVSPKEIHRLVFILVYTFYMNCALCTYNSLHNRGILQTQLKIESENKSEN